ncbi:MAG: p-hydroxyphenylacetate 3-hydroxylase reductase component [Halioglobus sp.]
MQSGAMLKRDSASELGDPEMAQPAEESVFDAPAFRRALGNFATGVTVITARGATGVRVGVTASSFNSVSLEPPLILWSSIKDTPSSAVFESASHFAVNILAADQMELSNHFARQQEDKFAGLSWAPGVGGAPLLPGCSGRFQCEAYDKVDGGDHWIFIGKVVAFDDFGRSPLCFHQGSYSMVFSHPGSVQKSDTSVQNEVRGGRMANHTFFMMLKAVRAYQSSYQPKLEPLGLSLVESRSLFALNDQPDLSAEQLVVQVNSPLSEVEAALANLRDRGMIIGDGKAYRLTSEGKKKAHQCWDLAYAHAAETFEQFSEEQLDSFKDVLLAVIDQ